MRRARFKPSSSAMGTGGYASRQWTGSATVDFVERSADRQAIYSNSVNVIAFFDCKEGRCVFQLKSIQ